MAEPGPAQITMLLERIARGEADAAALVPLVYEELRLLARKQLGHEGDGGGATISPTVLVHEAYLKLMGASEQGWECRRHFFGSATRAMRQILVDRARKRASIAAAAGGRLPLDEATLRDEPAPADTLAMDRAVSKLEERDARQAEIVMLRFYAGLTIEQTAAAMNLSTATVKNEWAYARAWLRRELGRGDADAGTGA